MTLLERHATPAISQERYKQLKEQFAYLTPEMGRNQIEPNCVYWDWEEDAHSYQAETSEGLEWRREKRKRKQVKFLLLPNAISSGAYHKAHMALCAAYASGAMSRGSRAANGQRYGTKLTVGWYPQLPGHAEGSGYFTVRTAPTLDNPQLVSGVYDLLKDMDRLIEESVPDYYDYAWKNAMRATRPAIDEDDLSRVTNEHDKAVMHALDPWELTYTIRGTVFSTVELNRNIVFKCHEDEGNVDGTCVCIAALGTFVGGRLCFPRYGYSAELGPRDLLICDNNYELHGNFGPIVGERYSVVAFLHKKVCGRGD